MRTATIRRLLAMLFLPATLPAIDQDARLATDEQRLAAEATRLSLAEVYFQCGDQAKAIELMRRCSELQPRREIYRRQLKRFTAGDRFADVRLAN